jgi:hypothetical protein
MNIILRQHTLDVNSVALKHLTLKGDEKGPAVLITRSPGIGKSMSSLPALVRGLALGQAGPAPPVIIIIELRQLHTVLKLTFKVPAVSHAHGACYQSTHPTSPCIANTTKHQHTHTRWQGGKGEWWFGGWERHNNASPVSSKNPRTQLRGVLCISIQSPKHLKSTVGDFPHHQA